MAGLTERQARFAAEYPVDGDPEAAARRAGYRERTAGSVGRRLLEKEEVRAAIRAAEEDRTGITPDRVAAELASVAFREAGDGSGAELKYASKLRALELLGKHLGMFEKSGLRQPERENNLLKAIQALGEVETDDLPEVE